MPTQHKSTAEDLAALIPERGILTAALVDDGRVQATEINGIFRRWLQVS